VACQTPDNKIKLPALQGRIFKQVSKAEETSLPTCTFGKATRKPWRYLSNNKNINPAKLSGECVSVDSLESNTAGL